MSEIRDRDLVRYAGSAENNVEGDLGVGVAGPFTATGRVVDFSDTVGLLCCVDEELSPAPGQWTPARALHLLSCGFSGERVAELSGHDRRWLTAQQRRQQRRRPGAPRTWSAGNRIADSDEPA